MSSPIYFFPRMQLDELVEDDRFRTSALVARGAAPAFAGVKSVRAETSSWALPGKGPGGQSGVLVRVLTAGSLPARLGYYPELQDWHEWPAGCECWVGIDRENPPTPADLARPKLMFGHDVELGDGNLWRVPVLRSPFGRDDLGRSALPRDYVYTPGGVQILRRASSDALWELSGQVWDHYVRRGEHPTISIELLVDVVLRTIALNYRVGPIEQNLLHLVTSDTWEAAVKALLDVHLVDEVLAEEQALAQKKTETTPAPP